MLPQGLNTNMDLGMRTKINAVLRVRVRLACGAFALKTRVSSWTCCWPKSCLLCALTSSMKLQAPSLKLNASREQGGCNTMSGTD
jgi:hypothetical protein